jgi:hypothetical protein
MYRFASKQSVEFIVGEWDAADEQFSDELEFETWKFRNDGPFEFSLNRDYVGYGHLEGTYEIIDDETIRLRFLSSYDQPLEDEFDEEAKVVIRGNSLRLRVMGDDPDALVLAQGQQILITADDVIGPAFHRTGDHRVILGIPRHSRQVELAGSHFRPPARRPPMGAARRCGG